MAGDVTVRSLPAAQIRRRLAWLLLVLGVIGVHGCVTQRVVERMADLGAETKLPPRVEVAYVREMALSTPPPTAAPAAPPLLAPLVAPPASPKPPSKAASTPDARRNESPTPPPTVAASATDAPTSAEPEATFETLAVTAVVAAPEVAAPLPSTTAATATPTPPTLPTFPAASDSAPPFEWPASTRMTYQLTGNYRGAVSGSAQVEWIRVGARYQVHVDFIVGPKFAPLIRQRSSSDGEITAAGLAPRRFDQDIRLLTTTRPRQTIVFDGARIVLANGDVRPSVPGLQDTASQFVQLTYVFSTRPDLRRVGGQVDIPLALPKKVAVWTYDVVEEVTLQTPLGPLAGIHLKPRTNDQKAGTLSVEMWMAPQLRYLPVRIRFEQDAQNYVDLMISKPPEIAR